MGVNGYDQMIQAAEADWARAAERRRVQAARDLLARLAAADPADSDVRPWALVGACEHTLETLLAIIDRRAGL